MGHLLGQIAFLVDKHMGAVQRKMNLRIISGWRTLSRDAANVLLGVPSIRLLALERKEIWVEQEEYRRRQGHLPEEERNTIREQARETLFERWQEEWDSSKDGRWTHNFRIRSTGSSSSLFSFLSLATNAPVSRFYSSRPFVKLQNSMYAHGMRMMMVKFLVFPFIA